MVIPLRFRRCRKSDLAALPPPSQAAGQLPKRLHEFFVQGFARVCFNTHGWLFNDSPQSQHWRARCWSSGNRPSTGHSSKCCAGCCDHPRLAIFSTQELQQFEEGLLGRAEIVDIPQPAAQSMRKLGELVGLLSSINNTIKRRDPWPCQRYNGAPRKHG